MFVVAVHVLRLSVGIIVTHQISHVMFTLQVT